MNKTRKSEAGKAQIKESPLPPSPTVLLLVDFINPLDFEGAEAIRASAVAAARASAKLRRRLTAQGCATVYANDNYGIWRADFHQVYERCSASCPESAEIAQVLRPRKRDFTILKPRHSAFYATPLNLLLEALKCERLVITGIAADSCVLFSAMDAYLRGYSVWVPQDCIAAESAEGQEGALRQMAKALKADIGPSDSRRA